MKVHTAAGMERNEMTVECFQRKYTQQQSAKGGFLRFEP